MLLKNAVLKNVLALWLVAALAAKINATAAAAALSTNTSGFYYEQQAAIDSKSLGSIELVLQLLQEHSNVSMVRFGKAKSANLTAISWAHAVNSQQLLTEALNADIDMIEADIVLGKLNGVGEDLPVMAHPPANTSDLTLAQFLQQIKIYNELHEGDEKGVKLDFKSIEVFEGSLGILDENIPKMCYPIWLNADILPGPVEQHNTVPVDAAHFFAGCMRYKQAVLSIGWTTNWGAGYREGEYTQEQCDDMLETLSENNVLSTGQAITFPVRAGIAANSGKQLHELLDAVNKTNNSTLTIWSSANDYVDVPKLRELIISFGLDRVYLDVPEALASQLDLGNTGGATATFASLMNFSFISLCFWAFSSWLQQRT